MNTYVKRTDTRVAKAGTYVEGASTRVARAGTFKGKLVPDGVYVWKINYCGLENGKETEKELIGHVTVLK